MLSSPSAVRSVPIGVHVLTTIHGLGSLACLVLAGGSAVSGSFRRSLGQTGGSRLMLETFGSWTWLFLGGIALVLAILSYGSRKLRRYAWPLTVIVYSVGVLGSLWQVSLAITSAWLSAAINAGVVLYASTSEVRRTCGWSESGSG